MLVREDGRGFEEIRPIKIEKDYIKWAEGSCFVSLGDTKVICTASVLDTVPQFAREKNIGWVFAEYSMLPRSVDVRTSRTQGGRSHELQRIIGRSLRASIDLSKIPNISIAVDCDVIQADGSTRCASIIGGFVALTCAIHKIWKDGKIESFPIKRIVSAVSCGIVDGYKMIDLTYKEDSQAQCDITLIATDKSEICEIQGGVENSGYMKLEDFQELVNLGLLAISKIIEYQRSALKDILNI